MIGVFYVAHGRLYLGVTEPFLDLELIEASRVDLGPDEAGYSAEFPCDETCHNVKWNDRKHLNQRIMMHI